MKVLWAYISLVSGWWRFWICLQLVTYGAREFEVAERVKPLDNAFNGLFEVESGMDAANKVMIFDTLMDCSSLFLTGKH